MPKKRRITDEQALLLAIILFQHAMGRGPSITSDEDSMEAMFGENLPPNWSDGNTSPKSWQHVWEEVTLQAVIILKGLDREALRIRILNPDFRYTTKFPITPKAEAPKTVAPV